MEAIQTKEEGTLNNRIHNSKNPYQGTAKKVLCVCSAGLLRSPTAAVVLQREYGYNTRAAGLEGAFALIPVDRVLVNWADEIVCMNVDQQAQLKWMVEEDGLTTPVISLNIQDSFEYMSPELIELIKDGYKNHGKDDSN